ncbi:MAG: NAD(P)-dependent oxidoreductase [Pseudomonadota bacterium]
MAHILIAGGTGFVGLTTARAFADKGDTVVITSRKRHDPAGEALAAENDRISVEYVNIESTPDVFALFTRHKFDGLVILSQAHQYARTRAQNNAIYPMTLNLLEGARATDVKRVVLASSMAVYSGIKPPLNEDVAFPPKVGGAGPVAVPAFETTAKRAVEMIAFDYSIPMPPPTSGLSAVQENALEVVALRFPIQWGPGYTAMGNPFSLVCHTAAGRIDSLAGRTGYLGLPVPAFWNILSGSPITFVKDSASAITTTMAADTLPRHVYNVSSCFEDTSRNQLEALYRVAPDARDKIGIDPDELEGEARPPVGFTSDLLKQDFGWKPVHDTIEPAYEEYIAWLKDNPY